MKEQLYVHNDLDLRPRKMASGTIAIDFTQVIPTDSAAFSPMGRRQGLPPCRTGDSSRQTGKECCDRGNRHKSTLKMATWNCGGLTATCRGMCEEAGYDVLALTETHCANPTHGRRLLMSAPTPANDRFSGVALMISDRMARSLTFSGSVRSYLLGSEADTLT